MRSLLLCMLGMVLMALPAPVSADLQESFSPPMFAVPFGDLDEARLQAEVLRQALTFLQMVASHWGNDRMTLRKAVEGNIGEDEQNKLVYLRNIADHGVLEGYEFHHGSLVRGQYVVLQRPLNGLNEFIDYYRTLKRSVTETYGAPSLDRVVWNNDLYQPVPDYWGVAVMIGHLHYHAKWETADGTITLELTGNRHSRLFLEYQSHRAAATT